MGNFNTKLDKDFLTEMCKALYESDEFTTMVKSIVLQSMANVPINGIDAYFEEKDEEFKIELNKPTKENPAGITILEITDNDYNVGKNYYVILISKEVYSDYCDNQKRYDLPSIRYYLNKYVLTRPDNIPDYRITMDQFNSLDTDDILVKYYAKKDIKDVIEHNTKKYKFDTAEERHESFSNIFGSILSELLDQGGLNND